MTNAGRQPEGLTAATTGAEPPALAAQADNAPAVTKDYPYARSGVPTSAGADVAGYGATAATIGTDATGYGATATTADADTTGYGAANATTATTASANYPGYDSASGTAAGYHSTSYGTTNAGAGPTAGAGAAAGAGDTAYSAALATTDGPRKADYGAAAKAPITAGIDTTDAATAGVGAAGMDFVTSQRDEAPNDPD